MGWMTPRRAREATDQQLIATGAVGAYGAMGYDPIDGDVGYSALGQRLREIPYWTLERARAFSIASYRSNPMGRAIIDTYTSFCVGDSGLTLTTKNDDVRKVAEGFWNDPANCMTAQDLMLRSHMLYGETVYEMMTGESTGVVRRSPIDPTRISRIIDFAGNVLWPGTLVINTTPGETTNLDVARVDDMTGLRTGSAIFWRSWRALETDRRGDPFLSPVLDWLDNYDQVLSNLIDRTALARYLAFDVTVKGDMDGTDVDAYVAARGGRQVPKSGSMEVHNDRVEIKPLNAQSGSFEDSNTTGQIMTSIAGGTGLAKTWLAEPEHANRATSLSMAEPVRRRVGGVQNLWLAYQTDLARYAVDQAVAAGRLERLVEIADAKGTKAMVPAAEAVLVTGPEVAQADAQVVSLVISNLGVGLQKLVQTGLLSVEAGRALTRKAWEQFMGTPYLPELDAPDTDPDKIADHVDANAETAKRAPLAAVLGA